MNASIHLGKISGIPIGINKSWFLVFALITWSLSAGYFPERYPGQALGINILLGLVTSLLFFGSVLLHELGHAALALRNQIPVKAITLFFFGGVAQITREPRSAGAEFRIAIAGPLVSLGLAAFFGLFSLLEPWLPGFGGASGYLAQINLSLALFNMLPGFPLDGGRVLRAAVWKITGSQGRATQIASAGGQIMAFGFIAYGVFSFVRGDLASGLWMGFLGWFLLNAASSAGAQASFQKTLQGVTVENAMSKQYAHISSLTTLQQLVYEHMLVSNERYFFVTDGEQLGGLVTINEIRRTPQNLWRFTTAGQVMRPLHKLVHVAPGSDLMEALMTMETENLVEVPVVHENRLVGLLSRDQALRYLKLKTELGI
jgi:Zn-dependent protease/predicted transcriptional regulator